MMLICITASRGSDQEQNTVRVDPLSLLSLASPLVVKNNMRCRSPLQQWRLEWAGKRYTTPALSTPVLSLYSHTYVRFLL